MCLFFEFPVELRPIVYASNAVESLDARIRKAIRYHRRPPPESMVRYLPCFPSHDPSADTVTDTSLVTTARLNRREAVTWLTT